MLVGGAILLATRGIAEVVRQSARTDAATVGHGAACVSARRRKPPRHRKQGSGVAQAWAQHALTLELVRCSMRYALLPLVLAKL